MTLSAADVQLRCEAKLYHLPPQAYERGLHPRGIINCAGYKALTSMDQYLDLLNSCLPGEG